MKVTTLGLDLAKNVFQVHGIDDTGKVIVRRLLRRRQMMPFFGKLEPCLIGIEACGTSHFWAREIAALGHEVKLMPPIYVKPYVKRGGRRLGPVDNHPHSWSCCPGPGCRMRRGDIGNAR